MTKKENKTMTIIAHPDIIDAIKSLINDGDSLLTDILCDSYGYEERDKAYDLISSIAYRIL